jgi:hypothetical protein
MFQKWIERGFDRAGRNIVTLQVIGTFALKRAFLLQIEAHCIESSASHLVRRIITTKVAIVAE